MNCSESFEMKEGLFEMMSSQSRRRKRETSFLRAKSVILRRGYRFSRRLERDETLQRKFLFVSICILFAIFCLIPPDIEVSEEDEELIPVAAIPTFPETEAHGISPSLTNDVARNVQLRSTQERKERSGEDASDESVTIVAACKDRATALEASLPSWRGVKGVTEIVLVDYGSQDPSEMSSLVKGLPGNPNVAEVHVRMTSKEAQWSISRAYNLAASLASGRTIVKADCDTVLSPDFLKYHPIDLRRRHKFYTVDWSSLHSNPLAGVFVMDRVMFELAGGFDERIVSYGGENADLYERLLHNHGMYLQPLNKSLCYHLSTNNVASSPSIQSVTGPRENLMAVSYLRTRWNLSSSRKLKSAFFLKEAPRSTGFSSFMRRSKSLPTLYFSAEPQRWSIDAFTQLSDEELNEVETLGVIEALQRDYHVPRGIIEQLPIFDCTSLLEELHNTGSRALFAHLSGLSLPDRLNNFARAIALGASLKRPVVIFWSPMGEVDVDQEDNLTADDIFDLQETNEYLKKAGLSAKVLVGKQWPWRSSDRHERPETIVSRYTSSAGLYLSSGKQLQIANPSPNTQLFIELSDAKSLAEAKPIAISYTGDETDALYNRQGSDIYYRKVLDAIKLPAHIEKQRLATSGSPGDRDGVLISDSFDFKDFKSMMEKRETGAGREFERDCLISSGLPDSSDATAARERWSVHTVPMCETPQDLNHKPSCAQARFADIRELALTKTLWPDGHPDLRDTPGLKALMAMRTAINNVQQGG